MKNIKITEEAWKLLNTVRAIHGLSQSEVIVKMSKEKLKKQKEL